MAGAGAVALLAGYWLSRCAIKQQVPELDWLRRLSTHLNFKTTDFRHATLTKADFTGANLRHARFTGAQLAGTRWFEAMNLHLANTYGTVLQPRIVRDTLVSGQGQGADFKNLDLRGLDFSGLDLSQADFTDAELSGAKFSGADLRGTNLTRAVLLGADLSNAQLTGASIGHWNIDKSTNFAGVDCRYVYLDEEQHDRQPESGEFKAGEFEKLYQELAHTVDFLIENAMQMEALQRSLAKMRADFGEDTVAQVQKIERKGDSFKVSVEVQKELEEVLRKEMRAEFDNQLKALECQYQYQLLSHQKDAEHYRETHNDLKTMLMAALSRPSEIHIKAEAHAMHDDNSRKIEHSTISQSAVNLGDYADVQAHVSNNGISADALAPLLEQLRSEIKQCLVLPEAMKADALARVESLNAAAQKPAAEAKSTASQALEGLKTVGTVATTISGIVVAVAKVFGL
ncbi:MAG: hypothetical protein CTY18_08790 [Methylomonas sp.]|nr:MAG: hypothetical protein CTY24_15345 [Methylobacter sp.]PPD34175.1 MAG: hypothetical protein CTY18_08790 [Methylomonas sp.]